MARTVNVRSIWGRTDTGLEGRFSRKEMEATRGSAKACRESRDGFELSHMARHESGRQGAGIVGSRLTGAVTGKSASISFGEKRIFEWILNVQVMG